MDERIDKLIEILEYIIAVDSGISKRHSEIIQEMLDELKDGEFDGSGKII